MPIQPTSTLGQFLGQSSPRGAGSSHFPACFLSGRMRKRKVLKAAQPLNTELPGVSVLIVDQNLRLGHSKLKKRNVEVRKVCL